MQSGSDKHGPQRDDALKHDVENQLRSGRGTHVEEWKDPEPPGEDQPESSRRPDGYLTGGTPRGMDDADVEARTDLARYLGRAAFPADRLGLLRVLAENHAPDPVIDRLAGLPSDTTFDNVQEVAEALGIGVERRRS